MDAERARITVTRQLPSDVKQRQIVVSLDGQPLATLLFGQSVTREIEPGQHWIRAHNTLVWKTREFEAKPGEEVRFAAANRAGFGTYSMLGLLGVGPLYLTFDRCGPES
jgi:hypothetical protein